MREEKKKRRDGTEDDAARKQEDVLVVLLHLVLRPALVHLLLLHGLLGRLQSSSSGQTRRMTQISTSRYTLEHINRSSL